MMDPSWIIMDYDGKNDGLSPGLSLGLSLGLSPDQDGWSFFLPFMSAFSSLRSLQVRLVLGLLGRQGQVRLGMAVGTRGWHGEQWCLLRPHEMSENV